MIGLVRAISVCAALALGFVSAHAADKAFKRDDLADQAIRLEAQIKTEAGIINKTAATLKSDTDAAFKRSDLRGALVLLGQTAAVAPEDSGNWLRLAKTIFQIRPSDNRERTFFYERASHRPPISPTSARRTQAKRPTPLPCWAMHSPSGNCGVRRSMRCACRSTRRRSRTSVASTKSCAMRRVSGYWITVWIRIPPRRAPASSFRKTSPSGPTSILSWRWPALTARR